MQKKIIPKDARPDLPLRLPRLGDKNAALMRLRKAEHGVSPVSDARTAGGAQHKEVALLERMPSSKRNEPPWGSVNGFLVHIDLFSSLTKKELDSIRSNFVLKEFKKSQIILHEEETSEYMYIIVKGKVKISRTAKEGKEMILSMHGAGEFFGEMALIDGETVPATVSAMERSLIALISRDDFFVLLYAQNKVLHNLLRILCIRLREAWKRIQLLNFNDASQRVKMLFLMLSDGYGEKTAEGTTLRVRLIHQDIADMTGLTRETVTRVLDRLKRSGEIRINKSKLVHLNPEFESITL